MGIHSPGAQSRTARLSSWPHQSSFVASPSTSLRCPPRSGSPWSWPARKGESLRDCPQHSLAPNPPRTKVQGQPHPLSPACQGLAQSTRPPVLGFVQRLETHLDQLISPALRSSVTSLRAPQASIRFPLQECSCLWGGSMLLNTCLKRSGETAEGTASGWDRECCGGGSMHCRWFV